MKLQPEFERAWQFANNFMYKSIKDEKHLDLFLRDVTGFNDEEKEFLREAWHLIKFGEKPEEIAVPFEPEELEEDIADQLGLSYYGNEH